MIPLDVYERLYRDPGYAMGHERLELVERAARRGQLKDRDVLDVGCGRGESRAICERAEVLSWHGVEIVPALANKPGVRLVQSAARMPFADGLFDTVMCFDVLEHLRDEAEVCDVLREIWRVLALKGVFVGSIAWFSDTRTIDGREVELHTIQKPSIWWIGWLHRCGFTLLRETYSEEDKWMTFEALKP